MFRILVSLLLIVQMAVPARAQWRLAAALMPVPAAAKPAVADEPKVCPCSGKTDCNCCEHCTSAETDENDETPKADAPNSTPPNDLPALRCPCKATDFADPGVDHHSFARPLVPCEDEPPQLGKLISNGTSGDLLSLPIDTPPPRTAR